MSLNSKFNARNEAQVKVWMDKWLGSVALESEFSLLYQLASDPDSTIEHTEQYWQNNQWDFKLGEISKIGS